MKITPVRPAMPVTQVGEPKVLKARTTAVPLEAVLSQQATPAAVQEPALAAFQGQTAPAEQAREATKPLSPQFVELARQEKSLRKLREQVKAEQEAWKAQQSGYLTREALKADPIKLLNEAGVTIEQLTQLPQAATPESELKSKIEALEAKLSAYDSKQTERQKNDYAQALKVIEGDVNLLVDSDPAYETIKATSSQGDVVRLIEKVFETEGTILSIDEAAGLIEDKLTEQTARQVAKLSSLKKIKDKLAPKIEAAQKPAEGAEAGAKTLTNAMGSTRVLSPRERAMLAFHNQLNKG